MIHFYYYVPPCPRCKSRKTGRYIRKPYTAVNYTMVQSMKMGELIRFASSEPVNNAFCLNCGNEWPAKIELKLWPYSKIHEEQMARGTYDLYNNYLAQQEAGGAPVKRSIWDAIRDRDIERYGGPTFQPEDYNDQSTSNDIEVIDNRQKAVVEILYTDDTLIKEVLRRNGNEAH